MAKEKEVLEKAQPGGDVVQVFNPASRFRFTTHSSWFFTPCMSMFHLLSSSCSGKIKPNQSLQLTYCVLFLFYFIFYYHFSSLFCPCSSHPVCVVNIMDCGRLVWPTAPLGPQGPGVQMCVSVFFVFMFCVHTSVLKCASLNVWWPWAGVGRTEFALTETFLKTSSRLHAEAMVSTSGPL